MLAMVASYSLEKEKLLNAHWSFLGWFFLVISSLLYTLKRDRSINLRLKPPLTPRELFLLFAGSLALILFYQRGVDSWRYAFIGDEYGFLGYAISLIKKPFNEASVLEASGYAEFFPMLLSWWQALFLYLFGEHNGAWRLSVATITASGLIPFYLLLKQLLQRTPADSSKHVGRSCIYFIPVALVAITSLFLTEFTVVWAKIGKPHAVFLPPSLFAAAAITLGLNRRSDFYIFLSGMLAGLGTYLSSLSPILALATCGALLITLEFKPSRHELLLSVKEILRYSLILSAGFLIVAAPLLVQFDFWQNMFEVNITSTEAERNSGMFWAKLISAVMLPLEFRTGIHFMLGNPVDVVLALLIILGVTTSRLIGWRPICFALLLHLEFSLLAGALSKYHYPPESRMMVIMFPLAILAAFGFTKFSDLILNSLNRKSGRSAQLSFSLIICLWIASYHMVKLEDYNPYFHQLDSSMAILKEIQESDDPRGDYWLFASPLINRQPLQFFSQYFAPNFLIRSFKNDTEGLSQMKQILSEYKVDEGAGISPNIPIPSAILIEEQDSLKDDVLQMAQARGVKILSFKAWGLSPRRRDLANPLADSILPLIKLLEARGRVPE